MNFGQIDQAIIIGGHQLCIPLITALQKRGLNYHFFVGERSVVDNFIDDLSWDEVMANHDIKYNVINNAEEIFDYCKTIDNSIAISIAAPWIFTGKFISRFQGRLINFHSARLPLNRGGGAFSWRIMMGDREGALTIHLIDEGIDTGQIVRTKQFIYPDTCKIPQDYFQYDLKTFTPFIVEFLDDVMNGHEFDFIVQNKDEGSYFPRLNTQINAAINWSWDAQAIYRFICAFDSPYMGAATLINDTKVRIKDVSIVSSRQNYHPYQAGLVIRKDAEAVYVACDGGLLRIRSIRVDETGEPIGIKLGDRLHTPRELLDSSISTRVFYTSSGMKQP